MEKRRMERRFAAIQLSVLFERQKIATKTVPRRVEHPSLRTSSSFAFSDFKFLREMTGFGLSHSTYGLPASLSAPWAVIAGWSLCYKASWTGRSPGDPWGFTLDPNISSNLFAMFLGFPMILHD